MSPRKLLTFYETAERHIQKDRCLNVGNVSVDNSVSPDSYSFPDILLRKSKIAGRNLGGNILRTVSFHERMLVPEGKKLKQNAHFVGGLPIL